MIYCPQCSIPLTDVIAGNEIPTELPRVFKCGNGHVVEMKLIPPVTIARIFELLSLDRNIQAIKEIRNECLWGLRESKNLVDLINAIQRGRPYELILKDWPRCTECGHIAQEHRHTRQGECVVTQPFGSDKCSCRGYKAK
jgi:hypothetical protein